MAIYRVILILLLCCSLPLSGRADEPVAARLRHVVFHLGHGIEMRVDDLNGSLVSSTSGPPIFDDVNSLPVPFQLRASIGVTPDGRIRVHPTSMKAAGFVSKRVLDFFGLELEQQFGTPTRRIDSIFHRGNTTISSSRATPRTRVDTA